MHNVGQNRCVAGWPVTEWHHISIRGRKMLPVLLDCMMEPIYLATQHPVNLGRWQYHILSGTCFQLRVFSVLNWQNCEFFWDWDWDWDKFIQHNMTVYRCMKSDTHDNSYELFRTNMISITNLHVGSPLLAPYLVAYTEDTLARQQRLRNIRKVLTSFQNNCCGKMVICWKWM